MGNSFGWVPHDEFEWEDDIDMYGCEEIPEGWKTIETHIDRIDGYVRVVVTDPQGRTVFAARYHPDVARIMAQTLTLNALKIEDGWV
jgi:hypothetical protein